MNFETDVLGRDLHSMCEYGKDFKAVIFDRVQIEGSREMAKEICMKKFTDFSTFLSESTVAQSLGYSASMSEPIWKGQKRFLTLGSDKPRG